MKRRADIGLIAAFLIFIWLPTADHFLKLDQAASPNENRSLATVPPFQPTLAGAREFLAGLEAAFNDHFGFRRQLVRWEQRWKWLIFHDARLGNVLVGKGGWLFYSDGRMADDISGARPFSEAELEAWRTLLTGRRDWLRARGIRYLFVVPPDKQSIYPEHLPDWLLARARPPGRLDQFFNYMRAHSDVPILDLRETLLEAKKLGRIYRQTDTHWNERGAFAAYRRIFDALAAIGIRGTPLHASVLKETIRTTPGGDLALMLGQQERLAENDDVFVKPERLMPSLIYRVEASLIPKKWIPGTEPRTWENLAGDGRIIIFHDSFCNAMAPFMASSFRRAVFVWQQNWDKGFIEREKPDVVIDEMLERFVIFRSAEELRKKDEQPDAQVFADN